MRIIYIMLNKYNLFNIIYLFGCGTHWYVEWELRHSENKLECPAPDCDNRFKADQASWLDDRPVLLS